MEVLDKLLAKLKCKPKTFQIHVTDIKTRSCGNCMHHRSRTSGYAESCMHYPTAQLIEVNNKVCKPNEREHWSPKQYGVISRFFMWLF